MSYLKDQWTKYTARKSKAGIVIDFLLLFLFLAMLHPTSRMKIKSFVITITMTSPKETEHSKSLSDKDYQWTYQSLDGETLNLQTHQGKVIFLNFWATWCPPCVAEFPAIEELYQEYGDKIEFVLISNESSSVVKQFITKSQHKAPVYLKGQNYPSMLAPRAFPTTFVISKSGKVVLEKTGAAKWNSESVKNTINKLISE